MYKKIKRGRGESKNANGTGKKSNWTRLIILIRQQLNMHKWDLIHEAANAWSHSGGDCKCVLMYVLYHV